MSAQTSYSTSIPKAYAGLIFGLSPHDNISRSVETAAGFGFGVAVSRGTDKERQAIIGGDDFLGITYRDLGREGAANGNVAYSVKETAGIMRQGYIWAVIPTGGNPGSAIKYTTATGVIDVGVAGAGEIQLDGAQLDTVTTAGGLGVIRLGSIDTTTGA